MLVTTVLGLLFRYIYPITMIIIGIILYVILNNKGRPLLLSIAFIVYGVLDVIGSTIFLIALMSMYSSPHNGGSIEYIGIANIISSVIHMLALVVFAVLVIIGVNRILESEERIITNTKS